MERYRIDFESDDNQMYTFVEAESENEAACIFNALMSDDAFFNDCMFTIIEITEERK